MQVLIFQLLFLLLIHYQHVTGKGASYISTQT